MGSFASVLVWRTPRDLPWGVEWSECTSCHTRLRVIDLVPLLSWLFLRGKCRHCGTKISALYFFIELITMFACLGVYYIWGLQVTSFILLALVPFLIAMIFIDMEHFILPNQLVLISGCLGAVFLLWQVYDADFNFSFMPYIWGAIIYGALAAILSIGMEKILKKPALGWGDVKFFIVAGLWLGVGYLSFFLLLSGIIGVMWGIIHRLGTGNAVFPFGPALIIALYIGVLLRGIEVLPPVLSTLIIF